VTQVKGSNIRLAQQYAERRGGPEAWARVLATLSPADREVVQGCIAVGWYPLPLQHRVLEALEQELHQAGVEPLSDFARFVAEHDLTKVHRLYLRMRNPAYVLEKCGEYWSRFYDSGVWYVQRVGPTVARGDLSQIEERAPVFCKFLAAYIGYMFELAGAKGITVLHRQCACRGAPSCVFEGSWTETRA
jgi:hypothetical protein